MTGEVLWSKLIHDMLKSGTELQTKTTANVAKPNTHQSTSQLYWLLLPHRDSSNYLLALLLVPSPSNAVYSFFIASGNYFSEVLLVITQLGGIL